MEIKCSYSKLVPVKELKPYGRNRNKHPKEQIERLAKLIEAHGLRHPVIVSNLSGEVVAGNGRLEALKLLGAKEIPVDYQDFETEDAEYTFSVSDNAVALWAELDLSGINADIPDLGPFDIELLGIKNFEIEVADKEGLTDEDALPEKVEPRTKRGDLYQLGSHRLLCGDSTMLDDIEKLMAGEKADLWLTDPPYGVAYHPEGTKHEKIANDDLPLEEMAEFWTNVATNALVSCTDKAAYYWFACQGGDQMMMMMMSIGRANWKVRHELIWAKDALVMSRCDYHYKHEPILYGWKKDGTHEWYSDRKQTSVIEFPRPKKSEGHPTMKPVELIAYLMGNSTKQGQIVLDTFGGSGTTLMAAEKTNRKARLIELSEKYCDLTIARWEQFTGQKAELLTRLDHDKDADGQG